MLNDWRIMMALRLFGTTGHRRHIAASHRRLGGICFRQGDGAAAGEHFEAALELSEDMGDRPDAARCCKRLGDIYLNPDLQDVERSEGMYQRARAEYHELGDEQGEGEAFVGLGNVAARRADVTQAIAMWTAASERFRRLGNEDRASSVDVAMERIWTSGSPRVA